jgi:membrane peptidoglycan carboxypeptidase
VAIQIGEQLNIGKFVGYLRRSGIHIPLPNSPLLALGAVRLTIWEVLALFSPVMTNGYLSWIDDSGSDRCSPKNNGARIASRSATSGMKTLLRATAENGTATYLLKKHPFSLGGKTGTSEKSRDLWFVGAVDEHTYGAVWIGNQNEQPLVSVDEIPISASRFAVPMWSDVVTTLKDSHYTPPAR